MLGEFLLQLERFEIDTCLRKLYQVLLHSGPKRMPIYKSQKELLRMLFRDLPTEKIVLYKTLINAIFNTLDPSRVNLAVASTEPGTSGSRCGTAVH